MFAEKIANTVVKVYFTALAFMMYYFISEQTFIGGIGITFRHLFALLLIISAFVYFLITPKVNRAIVALKSSLVYAVPLLVVIVSSMLVWMIEKSDLSVIMRGVSGSLIYTNWLSCALAAGAMLYVFGEDGIWFNLLAMVLSNLYMIFNIILSNGAGPFFSQLIELIRTFAGVTGDVIVKAEIHELAFCMGAYLIYMLFKPKRKVWFWALFAGTFFCFICAFKRIAFVAMAAVVAVRIIIWAVSKISPQKGAYRVSNIVMIIVCVLLIGYIYLIKSDIFAELEKAGIETSGRAQVYEAVNQFYKFSPSFMGRGIGFLTYQLNTNLSLGVTAVHNDFLQFFIDLGFFGYIAWLISMTYMRTRYFGKDGDNETATICCLLIVYLVIVSSTDNTINYPLLTSVLGVIMMGNGFNKKVEMQKKKNGIGE